MRISVDLTLAPNQRMKLHTVESHMKWHPILTKIFLHHMKHRQSEIQELNSLKQIFRNFSSVVTIFLRRDWCTPAQTVTLDCIKWEYQSQITLDKTDLNKVIFVGSHYKETHFSCVCILTLCAQDAMKTVKPWNTIEIHASSPRWSEVGQSSWLSVRKIKIHTQTSWKA